MGRLVGAVLLAAMVSLASALAQSPMSPVYPTGPAKPRPARPPVKEIAPDHEASKVPAAAQVQPTEEAPVTTAVIPPPVVEQSPASTEPKKPATAKANPEAVPERHQAIKHHKRTARRARYTRRLYAPYPVGWYYDPGAATRGWGGGRFGPSPYSSNGQ